MTLSELIPLLLPVLALLLIWMRPRRRVARARAYRCTELVPNMDLAVTYRDAPMVECGRGTRVIITGECTPLCPKHHRPMSQID